MSHRVLLPALASLALGAGACQNGSAAPDARVFGSAPGLPDAPAARAADAPTGGGSADAKQAGAADAKTASGADAPVVGSPDAPLPAEPDAPVPAEPDAPVPAEPDAPVPAPDAAPPPPATVILNELSPDFPSQHDLVELLVRTSGTTKGIRLERDYPHAPSLLATLPDVVVAKGDVIVVHLSPAGTSAAAETLAVDEKKTADNFDGAWDFLGEANDLPYSNVVVAIRGADGTVQSAVPFFRSDLTDPDVQPRAFPADLQGIIDGGLWSETCAPAPCAYSSNLAAVTVGWAGVGSSPDPSVAAGTSVARKPNGLNMMKKSDWQQPLATSAPYNTYGAAN
jgi:hypothetical protein